MQHNRVSIRDQYNTFYDVVVRVIDGKFTTDGLLNIVVDLEIDFVQQDELSFEAQQNLKMIILLSIAKRRENAMLMIILTKLIDTEYIGLVNATLFTSKIENAISRSNTSQNKAVIFAEFGDMSNIFNLKYSAAIYNNLVNIFSISSISLDVCIDKVLFPPSTKNTKEEKPQNGAEKEHKKYKISVVLTAVDTNNGNLHFVSMVARLSKDLHSDVNADVISMHKMDHVVEKQNKQKFVDGVSKEFKEMYPQHKLNGEIQILIAIMQA